MLAFLPSFPSLGLKSSSQGNAAFRKGDYHTAVTLYEAAHNIESELPHYQLNLAAAHLKLNKSALSIDCFI